MATTFLLLILTICYFVATAASSICVRYFIVTATTFILLIPTVCYFIFMVTSSILLRLTVYYFVAMATSSILLILTVCCCVASTQNRQVSLVNATRRLSLISTGKLVKNAMGKNSASLLMMVATPSASWSAISSLKCNATLTDIKWPCSANSGTWNFITMFGLQLIQKWQVFKVWKNKYFEH